MVNQSGSEVDSPSKVTLDPDETKYSKIDQSLVLELVAEQDAPWIMIYDANNKRLNPNMQRMEDALDFVAKLIREYKKI